MELQNMGLLKMIEKVKACTDIDALAKLESRIIPECARRASMANDHLETTAAQHLQKQLKVVVSDHRRHLQSVSVFNSEKVKYDLGKSIAKGK